jgi:hypothetical protein
MVDRATTADGDRRFEVTPDEPPATVSARRQALVARR